MVPSPPGWGSGTGRPCSPPHSERLQEERPLRVREELSPGAPGQRGPGPGRLLRHLRPLLRPSRVPGFPGRAPPAAPDASPHTPSLGPEYSLPATPLPSIAAAQTLAFQGESRVQPLARAGGVDPPEAALAAREEAGTGERQPGGGTGEPLPSSCAVQGG